VQPKERHNLEERLLRLVLAVEKCSPEEEQQAKQTIQDMTDEHLQDLINILENCSKILININKLKGVKLH